jgi:hypothetical protein
MDYKVIFSKSYQFEGREYTEVDLVGLEELKASDLTKAETTLLASGQMAAVNEMSMGYACIVAAQASKKPIEFYQNLPAKDAVAVKSVITNFFFD